MDSIPLNNKEDNKIGNDDTKETSKEDNNKEINKEDNIKLINNEDNKKEINEEDYEEINKIKKDVPNIIKQKYNIEIKKELNNEKTVYEIKLNGKNFYALKIKVIKSSMEQKKKSIKFEQMIAKILKSERNIKTLATTDVEHRNENENENWIIFLYFLEKSAYRDLKKFITVFQKGYILRNSIHIIYKINWIFKFSNVTISYFLYQIILAILFLKLYKLNHYNLVPENILLCKFYTLKLCGFSKILPDEQNNDNKDSIYFILNLIYDMYDINKIGSEKKKETIENDKYISDELKSLINNCSETDLNKRWNIKKILESEFFKKYKNFIKIIKNNVFNEEYKFFIEMQKIQFPKNRKRKKFLFKRI